MDEERIIRTIAEEYYSVRERLTDKVEIRKMPNTPAGSYCVLEFTVKAPTHYLNGEEDKNPKDTNSIKFWVNIKEGYPRTKPLVYYAPDFHLASVNSFRSGAQCIDEWLYDEQHAANNSSLVTIVEKTIRDIIHDPSVARFDSMANSDMEKWQRANIAAGNFPTCKLSYVFKLENQAAPALPKKPAKAVVKKLTPPALPKR